VSWAHPLCTEHEDPEVGCQDCEERTCADCGETLSGFNCIYGCDRCDECEAFANGEE